MSREGAGGEGMGAGSASARIPPSQLLARHP